MYDTFIRVYFYLKRNGNALLIERELGRLKALGTNCCCDKGPTYRSTFGWLEWRATLKKEKSTLWTKYSQDTQLKICEFNLGEQVSIVSLQIFLSDYCFSYSYCCQQPLLFTLQCASSWGSHRGNGMYFWHMWTSSESNSSKYWIWCINNTFQISKQKWRSA